MISFRDFEIGVDSYQDLIWADYMEIFDYYLRKDGTVKGYIYDKSPYEENSGYFNNDEELSKALSIFYKEPIHIFIPVTEKELI
jgi:hypothetical protein